MEYLVSSKLQMFVLSVTIWWKKTSHIYTQCVNFCDAASKVGNRYSITIMICTGISPRCINHNHSVFIWQAGATQNFGFWCQDGWIQLGDPLSGHKSLLLLKE